MQLTKNEQLEKLMQSDMTTLHDFLRTGKSLITYKGKPLVYSEDNDILFIDHRLTYHCGSWYKYTTSKKEPHLLDFFHLERLDNPHRDSFMGTVIPCSGKGVKFKLILDGDETDEDVVPLPGLGNMATTLSYACVGQLLSTPGRVVASDKVADRIATLKLKVVASTADEIVPIAEKTKKHIAKLRKAKKTWDVIKDELEPPEDGMTLVSNGSGTYKWHRSATVLLSDGKKSYIAGQDEGTYFGCELTNNPKSISAAFTSLMPKQVRGKTGVLRQGEWFMVPVSANKVPAINKCICFGKNSEDAVILSKDDPESNDHWLSGGEFRVSADGLFANGCTLGHDDHEEIDMRKGQWYAFFKNTAVRSVSQEGVD